MKKYQDELKKHLASTKVNQDMGSRCQDNQCSCLLIPSKEKHTCIGIHCNLYMVEVLRGHTVYGQTGDIKVGAMYTWA